MTDQELTKRAEALAKQVDEAERIVKIWSQAARAAALLARQAKRKLGSKVKRSARKVGLRALRSAQGALQGYRMAGRRGIFPGATSGFRASQLVDG